MFQNIIKSMIRNEYEFERDVRQAYVEKVVEETQLLAEFCELARVVQFSESELKFLVDMAVTGNFTVGHVQLFVALVQQGAVKYCGEAAVHGFLRKALTYAADGRVRLAALVGVGRVFRATGVRIP